MKVPRTALALMVLAAVTMLAGCAGDPAFTSGKIYWELGEYDKAISELQTAIKNSPDAYQPHLFLGRAYADTDDLQKGHDEFFTALELAEAKGDQKGIDEVDNVITAYWLDYDRKGESFIGAAKYEDAIAEFEKAILIDPRKPDAYINLGYAYHMSMQTDKAVEIFEQALEYAPDNDVLKENLVSVYETKAGSLASLSDYENALVYFAKIERLAPSHPDLFYNMGLMHYQLKDYREAITYFDKHIDAKPDDEEVLYRKFLAFWGLGTGLEKDGQEELAKDEFSMAIEPLQKLIDLNYEELTYHRGLARIYAKLGDDEAAMLELKVVDQLLRGEVIPPPEPESEAEPEPEPEPETEGE